MRRGSRSRSVGPRRASPRRAAGAGTRFEDRDPTGEIAVVAWEPRHVRGAVRFVPRAIERAYREIELADARLNESAPDRAGRPQNAARAPRPFGP
jgi:hypothetical protein